MVSSRGATEAASLVKSGSAELADGDSFLMGPVDPPTALFGAGNLLSRRGIDFIDICGNKLRLLLSSMEPDVPLLRSI